MWKLLFDFFLNSIGATTRDLEGVKRKSLIPSWSYAGLVMCNYRDTQRD